MTCVFSQLHRRTTSALLAAAVVVLAGCLLAGRAGYQLVTVQTGSMSPTYAAGSLLLERAQPTAELRTGQVITYRAPTPRQQTLTHRVTGVQHALDGSVVVHTRGDANAGDDPWDAVVSDDQVWHVVAGVPHVGTVLSAVRRVVTAPAGLLSGALLALGVIWLPAGRGGACTGRDTGRRSGRRPGPGPRWGSCHRPGREGRRHAGRNSVGRGRTAARRAGAGAVVTAVTVMTAATPADAAWSTSAARGHVVRSARLSTPSIVSVRDGCLFNGGSNRDQVTVTLTSATDDRSGIRVERRTGSNGAWVAVATLAPTATTYADTTAAFLTRYGYRLTNTAAPWTGSTSPVVEIVTLPNCL